MMFRQQCKVEGRPPSQVARSNEHQTVTVFTVSNLWLGSEYPYLWQCLVHLSEDGPGSFRWPLKGVATKN